MKKIMFNDQFGLTQAVLDGRKTMTRRVVSHPNGVAMCTNKMYNDVINRYAHYQLGGIVAIAQSYMDIAKEISGKYDHGCITNKEDLDKWSKYVDMQHTFQNAYTNKMFVNAELMPHHIRITNVRVERLQDISDEDCLREGICSNEVLWASSMETSDGYLFLEEGKAMCYKTPQQAFAGLIDKVSGKGTWERNPYVFVYEFEKVD